MKDVKILLFFIFLSSCAKDEATINVSSIFGTDGTGSPTGNIGGNTSDQWKSQNFTDAEMKLFSELDTASLANTTMPTGVLIYAGYPNPFRDYFKINARSDGNYSGTLIAKYVIVNASMKPIVKNSKRLSSDLGFGIDGNFPSGKYRIYVTYSSNGNPHFLKFWGNIQKL
jgi:hypothetical protein